MRKVIVMVLGIVIVTAVAYGIYFSNQGSVAPPAEKNVLLVTLDTTPADRLGCYGYPRPTSPNIDEFASDSVIFHMAIAQAAVTPVSHASILTGMDPHNHGLRVLHGIKGNELEEGYETLAEVWKKTGGLTAAFISAYTAGPIFGLAQGFDQFEPRYLEEETGDYVSERGVVTAPVASQRRAKDTTDKAIAWLQKNARKDRRIFMWVRYFDPHDANLLPLEKFMDEHLKTFRRKIPRSEDDKLREIYDAEVLYMDLHIGRLFGAFTKQGIWDETVVAVVADHGEGLGDHEWWSHGILYQEQIHVPMIVRVPGIAPRRLRSLVRTIDLAPTILDATGVDSSVWPDMDGKNLIEAMRTGSNPEKLLAYTDSVNLTGYAWPRSTEKRNKKYDKLYCLMDARHKLIYHQLKPEKTEFYDLQADFGEMKNLADSEPEVMKELMEQLKEMDAFSDIMPVVNDEELVRVKRLKSLGYVQ